MMTFVRVLDSAILIMTGSTTGRCDEGSGLETSSGTETWNKYWDLVGTIWMILTKEDNMVFLKLSLTSEMIFCEEQTL
jgi:hypothetical protein